MVLKKYHIETFLECYVHHAYELDGLDSFNYIVILDNLFLEKVKKNYYNFMIPKYEEV